MGFAFLVHPLTARYVSRVIHWTRPLPGFLIERLMKLRKPFEIMEFSLKGVKGFFIGCPLTSKQLITLDKRFVLKRLMQSCNVAERLGAKIISLGAFSAIASNHGLDLVNKVDVGLTTGRAYTVYVIMEQAKPYIRRDSVVGVVGAKGAIGSVVSELSSNHKLIKITRENFNDVYKVDVVISATSSLNEIIDARKLKKNCIVIDASKPSSISEKSGRKDITIIKGGLVKLPEPVDFGFDFDCPKDVVYACMAEPMILAMAGKFENFCLGNKIPLEKIQEIGKLGKKFGFSIFS